MSKLVFIGCGKSKLSTPSPAADLYCGSMFRARVKYAEASGEQYFILSAKHGLISPETIVAPYEQSISDLSPLDQIAWSIGVASQLCEIINNDDMTFSKLREVHCEIHAGKDYAERLLDVLIAAGFSATWPVRGMFQGSQLQWYSQNTRLARATAI